MEKKTLKRGRLKQGCIKKKINKRHCIFKGNKNVFDSEGIIQVYGPIYHIV